MKKNKNKSITSTIMLLGTKKISECNNFHDISDSLNSILTNSIGYKKKYSDFPAVTKRIKAYAKKFNSNIKFRRERQIESARETHKFHTEVMCMLYSNLLEEDNKKKKLIIDSLFTFYKQFETK